MNRKKGKILKRCKKTIRIKSKAMKILRISNKMKKELSKRRSRKTCLPKMKWLRKKRMEATLATCITSCLKKLISARRVLRRKPNKINSKQKKQEQKMKQRSIRSTKISMSFFISRKIKNTLIKRKIMNIKNYTMNR